jgi:hypothetical protein
MRYLIRDVWREVTQHEKAATHELSHVRIVRATVVCSGESPGGMRMSQVNPKELHPEVWKLFDRYVHGLIDRRGFLDGTAKYAVGGVTAVGILEALAPNYAAAQIQVQPNDSRVKTERVEV